MTPAIFFEPQQNFVDPHNPQDPCHSHYLADS